MEAPKFRIYNVWHERIFDELLEPIPASDRRDLVMYAVNDKIPKSYASSVVPPENVVREWELPLFEPRWQEKMYCQTTCMYHVFLNGLHRDLDYVGFCQYDMRFDAATFAHIRATLREGGGPRVFCSDTQTVQRGLLDFSPQGTAHMVDHYARFHGVGPDVALISAGRLIPILHTFVIPRDMFERMMRWVSAYMHDLERAGLDTRRSGGWFYNQASFAERMHALFIGVECERAGIEMVPLRLAHVWPLYHNQVPFESHGVRAV